MKTIALLLSLTASILTAQESKIAISAHGGYSEGFSTMCNIHLYLDSACDDFYEFGLHSSFLNDINNIPVDIYTLHGGFNKRFNIISATSNSIISYIGIGGHIGYEQINKGNLSIDENTIIMSKSGLVYGPYISFQTDIFLFKRFSLLPKVTYFYQPNSTVGKSKFMAGIGLKWLFKN